MGLNQYIVETTSWPFNDPVNTGNMVHTISPASGYSGFAGIEWPDSGAMPNSFSNASWGYENRGAFQQTFLGASIRSFSMNGGFGDTSSTLTVELINDEYNKSDGLGIGEGDDVYHSGGIGAPGDRFSPPPVGSPVFFKFGPNFATVEEAYLQTFDDLYSLTTTTTTTTTLSPQGNWDPNNFTLLNHNQFVQFKGPNTTPQYVDISPILSNTAQRGRQHLVFGGILQSYTQNKGMSGGPLFTAQVVDPREILANVVLVMNNYAGTIYNTNNILNIYGFLEHNTKQDTINEIVGQYSEKKILKKIVGSRGEISYINKDEYGTQDGTRSSVTDNSIGFPFPITGTGFARRGPQGIPYYRVAQAVNALMGYNGRLPQEYIDAGYGGPINFRGHYYVVDFGGLPSLPNLYYLDFDQINLLDLALEICDITSRDLYVTLLPVIDHPSCKYLYEYNKKQITNNKIDKIISGIIRLDVIDRSRPPAIGAIKNYLDSLASSGIYVENQDVGYELSNITTDKFIVGAQEVDMYFFSTNADRDNLAVNSQGGTPDPSQSPGYEWKLETSLKQQVLPYYGKLGDRAVTIPKGFGAYQQILLDTTGLNANGVGSYYVATEMELRCALISYDRWKEFLKIYNDIYVESLEKDDSEESAALLTAQAPQGEPPVEDLSNNYGVTVPRSVFNTYAPSGFGPDKLPFSPCNPPYGYPLYYKRMTKLGIPEGGLTEIQTRYTSVLTFLANLKSADASNYKALISSAISQLREIQEGEGLSDFEDKFYKDIEDTLMRADFNAEDVTKAITIIEEAVENFKPSFMSPDLSKLAKKNTENALKVYNFLRNIAEECLGKKFLVKIPKKANLSYQAKIEPKEPNSPNRIYGKGPFGFKPRPKSSGVGYEFTDAFKQEVDGYANNPDIDGSNNFIHKFLSSGIDTTNFGGALRVNFNPVADKYEFNYYPCNDGGFHAFDLYQNFLTATNVNTIYASGGYNELPSGIQQGLIPVDLTNFISENSRVSAYVRFDHSEHLSFDGFNSADFTQQSINAMGMIPDLSEKLDNVKSGGEFHSFPSPNNNTNNTPPPTPSIAFLKCTVDDNLYMPPKTSGITTNVHAQSPIQTKRKVLPRKLYVPCENKYVDSFSYYKTQFVPDTAVGESVTILDFISGVPITDSVSPVARIEGALIKTSLEDLDTEHVYALITLPGRVVPTKDARFRDGPFQTSNAERFKHFMTMDVVKGLQGFDKPKFPEQPLKSVLKRYNDETIPPDIRVHAWAAAKKANDSMLSFGFPQTLNAAMPSPVYPDLVCLPLMSMERCYGPWVSSHLDVQATIFSNVGGRIEFIKDENLSPWNYDGYDFMNEAGKFQAVFTNNLFLFSERGGFVVPGRPVGASLGKALLNSGPLVTNIQVEVSDAGVRTTYKLDLYTANFGKLQKQKQELLSKMSRERQKLRDERNALIRKGIGKNQNTINYGEQYKRLSQGMVQNAVQGAMQTIGKGISSALTTIGMTARQYDQRRWSSDSSVGDHTTTHHSVEGSLQANGDIGNVMQNYIGEQGLANSYMNSASASFTDLYMPASMEESHPNMAAQPNSFTYARQSLYFNEDSSFSQNDINQG